MTRTSGIPSIIMSPDSCPWTQIRLGAGTRNVHTCYSPEAADDLNHNVFALLHADQYAVDPQSASRSFVLTALRALHLDPAQRVHRP